MTTKLYILLFMVFIAFAVPVSADFKQIISNPVQNDYADFWGTSSARCQQFIVNETFSNITLEILLGGNSGTTNGNCWMELYNGTPAAGRSGANFIIDSEQNKTCAELNNVSTEYNFTFGTGYDLVIGNTYSFCEGHDSGSIRLYLHSHTSGNPYPSGCLTTKSTDVCIGPNVDAWMNIWGTNATIFQNSSTLTLNFTNTTDLTNFKSLFDEGENFFAFSNWTDDIDGSPITDSDGVCSIILFEGLEEDNFEVSPFTLCDSVLCDFTLRTHEFEQDSNISVLEDQVRVEICHSNSANKDLIVTFQCGAITDIQTVFNTEFPICNGDPAVVVVNSSACIHSLKTNITLSNIAPNPNQAHLITAWEHDREFIIHETITTFNSTLGLWQTLHDHEYYKHGLKNITVNCTHNTDPNFDNNLRKTITIVNIPPRISIDQLTYLGGIINLTDNIEIEYFSDVWQWFIAIIDDDLDTHNVTFYNSSGSIIFSDQHAGTHMHSINTSHALFRELANVYNITVWANDTNGNMTRAGIEFNVTDTAVPVCVGLDNASIINVSDFIWNVTCTDESFFSFNISCIGKVTNFSQLDTGLDVTSYSFTNTTRVNETLTCAFEYCDGHTSKYVEINIVDSLTRKRKTFDGKIQITSSVPVKEFNTVHLGDRYSFEIIPSVAQGYIEFNVVSDIYISIRDQQKYMGWLITGDYWIDFEGMSNVKKYEVVRISDTEVIVKITFHSKQSVMKFNSIGKLNCVSGTQTITTTPSINLYVLDPLKCKVETTAQAITMIGFTLMIVFIWAFALWISIPMMSFFLGFLIMFYGWNVAPCFMFAHFFFFLMGIVLSGKGFLDAIAKK